MSAVVVSTSPVVVVEKKVRMPTSLPAKYGKFIQFGYFLMNKLNSIGDEVGEDGEVPPPVVDEKVFLDKLMVFESLENQQAFVQEFLDSSKDINQGLRKMVLVRKRELAKADKPTKEKKEKKVNVSSRAEVEDRSTIDKPKKQSDGEPKEKKGKGKKVKVPTTEDQLVNELVQLATTSKKDSAKAAVAQLIAKVDPIVDKNKVVSEKDPKADVRRTVALEASKTTPILPHSPPKDVQDVQVVKDVPVVQVVQVVPVVKDVQDVQDVQDVPVVKDVPVVNDVQVVNAPKEKKEPVVKAPKEKKEPLVKVPKEKKEPLVKVPKEEKEPLVKVPKEEKKTHSATVDLRTIDQLDDIQVSPFEYNGLKYLIDDDHNVYDYTTQLPIATFINNTLSFH